MKTGIAISTYADNTTSKERINIIKKSLDSFKDINIPIIVINDCSTNLQHIELINSYDYVIINREYNGGISKSKNSSLHYFENNDFDFMFLIDDDMQVLDNTFYEKYVDAYIKTGIHHMSFQYALDNPNRWIENINGTDVSRASLTNGCLMTVTKKVLKEIGYFKILPYRYGHEHTNYTFRCINNNFAPGYIDIIDSEKYINLIEESRYIKSAPNLFTKEQLDENSAIAFSNINNQKYIKCEL